MVLEKLIELLCEQLDIEADEVNENTDIVNDLGADSLDVVDLVMTLEDEFDIEIPDDAVENIETYFPEAANFSTDYSTGNFEITMQSGPGTSVANPYMRCRFFMSSDYNDLEVNFSGNFGHYQNDRVDEILAAIPHETDDAKLKDYYTELSKIMLEDCPCVPLMYRPQVFHEVNESVWTNYPQKDDGTNVPPMDCTDGYGVAALYNLELIDG